MVSDRRRQLIAQPFGKDFLQIVVVMLVVVGRVFRLEYLDQRLLRLRRFLVTVRHWVLIKHADEGFGG